MSTTKESIKVMKDGMNCSECKCSGRCSAQPDFYPIIDEIAKRTAEYLEMGEEYTYSCMEEDAVLGLVMRMYLKGAYWEAIDYLIDLFDLIDYAEASGQLTLLEASSDGRIGMMFLESLFEATGFGSIHTGDPSEIHYIS